MGARSAGTSERVNKALAAAKRPRPTDDRRWRIAQRLEKRFWRATLTTPGGLAAIHDGLDYGHQRYYLPYLAKWGLVVMPSTTVLEIGCGPCGLSPWIKCESRIGLDPLAGWFGHERGVEYDRLGYDAVIAKTVEDYVADFVPDMIVSCNMIDHVDDVANALGAVIRLKSPLLFIAYDVRHIATDLHPSTLDVLTVKEIMESGGHRLVECANVQGVPDCEPTGVSGRRVELWRVPYA